MRLVRYNPFSELSIFKNAFDDFFTDPAIRTREGERFIPAVDILDGDDQVELCVELPGMKKEDLKVHIEDRVLTVSGEHRQETEEKEGTYLRRERRLGSFKRAFTLSDGILVDDVTADYRDGILKVTLKKDKSRTALKQISVH